MARDVSAAPAELTRLSADAAELAQLDEVRNLYAELVQLNAKRSHALASQASAMLAAPRAAEAESGAGSRLKLHEALKRFPAYQGTAPLLLAPPAHTADALAPEKEDLVTRVAQLDEALAMLHAIAADPMTAAPNGGGSSGNSGGSSTPHTARSSRELAALTAGDAELRHHLSLGTRQLRSELEREEDAAVPRLLPLGSSLCRPYLSRAARKRALEQHEASERLASLGASHPSRPSRAGPEPLAVRLPCGSRGAAPALKLRRGDVLHVPFSASESSILAASLARHGYDASSAGSAPAARSQPEAPPAANGTSREEAMLREWARGDDDADAPAEEAADGDSAELAAAFDGEAWATFASLLPSTAPAMNGASGGGGNRASLVQALREASSLLPGRSPVDCLRFWQSGEFQFSAAAPPAASATSCQQTSSSETALWRLDSTSQDSTYHAKQQPPPVAVARKRVHTPNGRSSVGAASSGSSPGSVHARRLGLGARRPSQLISSLSGRHIGGAGLDYRAAWRALHCGYRASSVSTKPTGHVADLAFAPSLDLARLAVGSTVSPHEALLYDLRTGKCMVLGAAEPRRAPPARHGATVPCVRFTAAGTHVLTASYDQTVRVWRASDGALQHVLGVPKAPPPPEPDDVPANDDNAADAASVDDGDGNGDGNGNGDGDGDGDGGAAAAEEELEPPNAWDDEAAAAAAEEPAEPAPWAYVGAIEGHANHVTCMAAHPRRDELVASGGKDAHVILWDVHRGTAMRKLDANADPLDLCFGHGPSERHLFGAIDDSPGRGGQVAAWDLESGACLFGVPQPRGHVSCLHSSRAGSTLLVGAADGSVRLLSSADGREVFNFRSGMSDVNLVSFSSGQTFVQASGDTNETYILDVRRPDTALHVLRHESVQHVNGVSAAWCHRSHATLVTGSDDTLVRIWDVSLGVPEVARLRGHSSPVSCVAVSAEDELIASGGDEGKAVLYGRRTDAGSAYLIGREQDNVLLRQRREDEELQAHAP